MTEDDIIKWYKKDAKEFLQQDNGINVLNLRELEELETIIDFYIK